MLAKILPGIAQGYKVKLISVLVLVNSRQAEDAFEGH